jgi:hypothetical protein
MADLSELGGADPGRFRLDNHRRALALVAAVERGDRVGARALIGDLLEPLPAVRGAPAEGLAAIERRERVAATVASLAVVAAAAARQPPIYDVEGWAEEGLEVCLTAELEPPL